MYNCIVVSILVFLSLDHRLRINLYIQSVAFNVWSYYVSKLIYTSRNTFEGERWLEITNDLKSNVKILELKE